MANPELLIYQSLRSLFTKSLPKGMWMLQRIETSTGTGIPDCYFSHLNNQFWIETKTVDYKVSNDQLNWASSHWRTGGLTYIVTRVAGSKTTAKQGIKHAAGTAHKPPNASSNVPTHATPYPTLLELYKTPVIPVDNGIVSYDQLTNSIQKKSQETLIFLAFDDRMRECSTLGAYLRKFNPDVLPVDFWIDSVLCQPRCK